MDSIIDNELLINLIQQRPAIWDMRSNDYADRIKRKSSWEEVVILFAKDDATKEEKKNLGTLLQKKWKNLRDRYSRETKERKGKSGQAVRKKSPYMYVQQLSFLEDTIKNRPTSDSIGNNEIEEPEDHYNNSSTPSSSSQSAETPSANIGKKRKLNPVETRLIQALESKAAQRDKKDKLEEDDDKLFLLSVLPSLKLIPTHVKLSARMDILQCINKYIVHSTIPIHSSNVSNHQFAPTTSYHSAQSHIQQQIVGLM